jgi:transposase InsO family protein
MTDEERREEAERVADFRYGLIAEFANPYLSREERRRMLAEKARVEYEVPRRGRRKLTAGCLRNWLRLYLKYGKPGLLPQSRRDAGTPRSLSPEEAALLLSYLESHPELCASVALKVLQKEGKIRGCPSSSSLSRLVRAAGMQRPNRLRDKQREETHKFDFSAPLECVQVDGLYTVVVPAAKARKRQAVLMSFLDDATRRVVYGTFGFSENTVAFEQGIKHILKAHGKIGRVYVDHGSAFVSGQTQRILDTLGIILVHSRVGRPSGRGKIERYHRTVRDQFLRPLDVGSLTSLEDLDSRFHSWLESEYHRSPHRGLEGKTPLEAWVENARFIVPLPAGVDLDRLFLHEVRRMVYKDSTVTLDGVLYEVPSVLIGQRVSLLYDPAVPPVRRRLVVVQDGRDCAIARLVDSYANTRVRRGDLLKDPVSTDVQDPAAAGPESSPLDAGLSASRIRLEPDEDPGVLV